jgi:hypothetical protein
MCYAGLMLANASDTPLVAPPDEHEAVRDDFRPERVKVLLIGESRPSNGTFFYRGDSRLAKYTWEAIGREHRSVFEFLRHFQSRGCFLMDLCREPVNHLPAEKRKIARMKGEQTLQQYLRDVRPLAIIVVMKGIVEHVERALKAAGLGVVPRHVVPFPAQGHEREYVAGLRSIFLEIEKEKFANR